MAKAASSYVARPTDAAGFVEYSAEENETWAILYQRQMKIIHDRACAEYLRGLEILDLPHDRVAQAPDVSKALHAASGWQLAPVAALIPFGEFFELLANRRFPAATFIRRREELDYLQEPDIFHEVYGHCPMLTNPVFGDFVQNYGKLGVAASDKERVYLARLFWFTVEFGLIRTDEGLRIYGAGILSSKGETPYSLEDDKPERRDFDVMTALRTPYRIDIFQTVYYVINDYQQLYDVMNESLLPKIHEAMELGLFPPTYPPKDKPPPDLADKHVC